MQGLESTLELLEVLKVEASSSANSAANLDPDILSQVLELGKAILEEINAQDQLIAQSSFEHGHDQSFESFELAKQYCRLHAAIACILMWVHNRPSQQPDQQPASGTETAALGEFFFKGEWLVLSLHRLLSPFRRLAAPPEAYHENVAQALLRLHQADKMFSIVPFQLAQSSAADRPVVSSSTAHSSINSSTKEATTHATAPELQLR
jgi:hypothetical protein